MSNQFFIETQNNQTILSDNNGEIVRFPTKEGDSPKREIDVSEYRENMNNNIRRISGSQGGSYDVETQQSFVYGFIAGLKAAGKPV
jgi:hypothetical protein